MFDTDYAEFYVNRQYSKNADVPAGVHIMNKNESKALRILKMKTGLSEEEIRKVEGYRRILSKAQKAEGNKTWYDRQIVYFIKSITRELKLPVNHPLVKEKIKERMGLQFGTRWFYREGPDSIIATYLRLRKKQKENS